MVGHLIRLRFTIQSHTLRWKRLLGLGLGLAAAAATWAGVIAADQVARHDVTVLALTCWLVGWLVGPILTSGASVLRPEYFALLPLRRRQIGVGLLATVFVGVGAVVTVLASLATVGYGVLSGSWAAAAVALVVAALFTVGVVALSRTGYAIVGAAMRTRLGVEIAAIQYGILLASLFAGWLVIAPATAAAPVLLSDGLSSVPAAVTVLDATPPGWVVRAVDAAAGGDPAAALGWTGLVAAFAAGTVAAAVHLLVPDAGARPRRRRRGRARERTVLPATAFGAVLGKELRTWWRDPWRSLEMRSAIWFGIVLAVLLSVAGAAPWAAWSASAVALMAGLSGANLYGQDGTALWQLVAAQSRAAVRADVRGRQAAIMLAMGAPAVVLMLGITAVTSQWRMVPAILTVIVVVLGAGAGVSSLIAVLAVTPGVEPAERVDPNDAGENSLAIQVALWATAALVVPTVAPLVSQVAATGSSSPWLLLLAAANGGLLAWGLGAAATRILDTRLPETFARLRYPMLPVSGAGDGGGLLERFARAAEKSAQQARAAQQGKS